TASPMSVWVKKPAITKKNAESAIPIAMNGRQRPRGVQIRSEIAPTVGWMTTPSMLRVLERRPVRRSGAPKLLSIGGRPKWVIAVAAVAVAIALRRPIPESGAMVAASVSAQVQAAQQGIQGNVQLLATTIEDLRSEVHRSLGAAEQNLATQATSTQRTLTELSRQLGTLGEQSQRIGDLAKDIGSLQDLLRAPKARGGFGALLLERLF